jgi:predicted CXXCH cytochrome family protein
MNNLMKHSLVFAALAGVLFGNHAMAASIVDSKHNLGNIATAQGTRNFTSATAEVCVFCHTPHGAKAKDGTEAVAPLWNKKLPLSTSFTTYDTLGTSSLMGEVAKVGSVSIACLSCHDGSQAMDVMINQPGSGGYNAGGASPTGTWTTNGTVSAVDANGKMLTATPIPGIGTDLTDDHPVGIQYAGGLKSGTDHTLKAEYRNPDFNAAVTATVNGQNIWYVPVPAVNPITTLPNKVGGVNIAPAAGIRNKTDMALYSRTSTRAVGGSAFSNGAAPQPFVECASCHDPHQANTATFLRIDNTGSAVCLACHVK